MTITMRAFAANGAVIKGDKATCKAQTIEDRGDYYAVIIHSNYEIRFTKKYWKVEMIA